MILTMLIGSVWIEVDFKGSYFDSLHMDFDIEFDFFIVMDL